MDKILVIDDSEFITKIITVVAHRAGYAPYVASSLKEAEAILEQSHNFACACVDYNLPDAPNGEAIDFVVSQDIQTFVLTGNLDETIRERILSKQVIDYIPKETAQSFDYVQRLLVRLRENREIRILVVDDSKSSRNYVKTLLKRQNFLIAEAENGQQALELLGQYDDIKLIITDHEMPVMSGIDLTSEARQTYEYERLAIIGISGSSSVSLSARFLKNGANDFLIKPFSQEEFYTRVFRNVEAIENIATARHAAEHDFLTDLLNRRAFFEKSAGMIDRAFSINQACAVALMDLDHFKQVNDTYGHDAGDTVLREMAHRLRQHFPEPNILVTRLGGEEFCVFIASCEQAEAAGRMEFFRHHLESFKFELPEKQLQVTTSIGLVMLEQGQTLAKALTQADQALYKAKEAGRNTLFEA
ncbi:diguanylate cyclase [Catenovulum sp. SM1970]|uniref:GGDEF domain-containing response regulator n=1 Tax=Marinifaba aquimaris TaxID=2741323 RepID=UPI0015744D4E|nr:diguanylate cyclase [Marinifaba aquimaris]NTS76730.1 diguanylate cyclase [Marinifaba aquimaris]